MKCAVSMFCNLQLSSPHLDQRGPGVPPPSPGKQPLPHRGERIRLEEGPQVQRAHYSL